MFKIIVFILVSVLVLGCNPGEDSTSDANVATEDSTVNNQPVIEPVIEMTTWENSKCPVMPEDDIDPEVSVEYQGKTLNLCCKKCIKKFTENPEKYHDALMTMIKK